MNEVISTDDGGKHVASNYKALQTEKIAETVSRLHERICDRFPESSLGGVCGQLAMIAADTKQRVQAVAQPMGKFRIAVWILCGLIVFATISAFIYFSGKHGEIGLIEFIGLSDAGLNSIVLIGASIYFLLSLEKRLKRTKALKAIDELRSIAHIIDMHQLTKDPERLAKQKFVIAETSPRFEMTQFELQRYLDYCSELLSLTSKVGAVYTQSFDDEVCIASSSELENLCTGLSRKIWQKILLLGLFTKSQGNDESVNLLP